MKSVLGTIQHLNPEMGIIYANVASVSGFCIAGEDLAYGLIIHSGPIVRNTENDCVPILPSRDEFFSTGSIAGLIPMPVALLIFVYLVTAFVYFYTPFGTKTRAIGSNEGAARTTGIKVDVTLILVFVVTAVTASIAGILNTAQVSTGNPTLGVGFELDAITAVVLGGTALAGGKGNVLGTLVGAILVTFVKMGLNMMGVGEAYQKLAVAIVLVFALTINGIKLVMQRGEK